MQKKVLLLWVLVGSVSGCGRLWHDIDLSEFTDLGGLADLDFSESTHGLVDYWELRYGGPVSMASEVTESASGECIYVNEGKCEYIAAEQILAVNGKGICDSACTEAVSGFVSRTGGVSLGILSIEPYIYLVTYANGEVTAITDSFSILEFFYPIDTIAEAALAVLMRGPYYSWKPDNKSKGAAKKVDDGFLVLSSSFDTCPPTDYRTLLHVDIFGEVKVLRKRVTDKDRRKCYLI